jgi:hypothetical protein
VGLPRWWLLVKSTWQLLVTKVVPSGSLPQIAAFTE